MDQASQILAHVTTFEEIGWGALLIAITMILHAGGMATTLSGVNWFAGRLPGKAPLLRGSGILVVACIMIVMVHLIEVLMWALFIVWKQAMPTVSSAYLYALNQYSTVGSDLSLAPRWALLSGLLAIAGLLTFAWSTSVLLTLVQRYLKETLTD